MNRFESVSGMELMLYNQWVRHFAMRERINDIVNFKVFSFGDIELPRNSLIHYTASLPDEVGPSNNSPFLNTYPKRINMFFDWEYVSSIEKNGIRIKPINHNQVEVGYFKSHFNYYRARQLETFLPKENELMVNNLAPASLGVIYKRKNVFTPFIKSYNELSTLINGINKIADISDRYQFFEIKLPNNFPTYQQIKQSFLHYEKFFNENYEIIRYKKEALKLFQTNKSFWLLDLYAFLLGYQYTPYSIFNKLTDKAREKTSIIFSYDGKCVICNIQTLLNLIGIADKEDDEVTPGIRINNFKRFYLNLISLVTNVDYNNLINEENEEEKRETISTGDTSVVDSDNSDSVVDNDGFSQDSDNESTRETRNQESKNNNGDKIKGDQNEEGRVEESPTVDNDDNIDETNWGMEISDEEFDNLINTNNEVINNENKINIKYSPTNGIERILEQRAKEGKLTNKEKEYFLSISNSYKTIKINGETIEEIIDIKPKDMVIKKTKLTSDSNTILDKSVLSSRTHELTKGYLENIHHRNIVEMITFSQNSGVCITDVKVEPIITAQSKYDVYTIKFQPVNGNASTRTITVPRVEEDGTFTINGNKSYMQIQRMEKPVRKISPNAVQLTSYYDKGRIIIERSKRVVDDYARWLRLRIINSAQTRDDVRVVLGSYPSTEKNMCYYYSILASRFKEIKVGDFEFVFDTHSLIKDDETGKEFCNSECWVIGKKNNKYLTIDNTGLVMYNNVEPIDYIEHMFDIDLKKAPIPVTTININGYRFPTVVVLSYWMGFNNLLKTLNVEYRSVEPNTRVELEKDEFVINFSDEKLIFNRRDELSTLIISGLLKIKNISDYSKSYLDDSNVWLSLMDDPRIKATHFKEMSLMYNMFIDPITKRLLERDKYPVVLDKLVISAIKLLLTQYSPAETEITEQRFVGYEKFSGHIYRELCKAARQFNNKPVGGKRTFDINPDAVMMNIITDPAVQQVEEVNPIHQLKQQEEVTYGGTLGRAERAMVRRTRGMHPNYVGIISEAGKDSSKVGFVSYLTVDPKMVDYYGNVDVDQPPTKSGLGSVTLNTLYGGTRDDTKRLRS